MAKSKQHISKSERMIPWLDKMQIIAKTDRHLSEFVPFVCEKMETVPIKGILRIGRFQPASLVETNHWSVRTITLSLHTSLHFYSRFETRRTTLQQNWTENMVNWYKVLIEHRRDARFAVFNSSEKNKLTEILPVFGQTFDENPTSDASLNH